MSHGAADVGDPRPRPQRPARPRTPPRTHTTSTPPGAVRLPQPAGGLIGDHDTIRRDVSTSGKTNGFLDSGRNVSTRIQRERVLDAAELAALPSRRMVMLASGTRAALLATQHWTERDGADLITESMQHYGPKNLTREPAVKSA